MQTAQRTKRTTTIVALVLCGAGCGTIDDRTGVAASALDGTIGSIDTYPAPGMYPFGSPGTLGETFNIPGGGTITKLKFSAIGTDPLELFFAAWDGAEVTGPIVDEGTYNPNTRMPWTTFTID